MSSSSKKWSSPTARLAGFFVGVVLIAVQQLRVAQAADPAAGLSKVVAPSKDKPDHWAFKAIVKTPPPTVRQADWVRTPIDQFVLAKLEKIGMAPSEPADKRTLLRRLTFDLIGLPPTPEEMAAFVADDAPDAYERVVDRLLESPRYGERWARHWMDVVHYADTHGNEHDRERPNAWHYRDYLIESFNQDKPYSKFIEQQLAGDRLYPDDPQSACALGFIAAGPWDESSMAGALEDTVDRKIAQNLDRDDMVATAMSTFASVTVHCARCHDHKFDPIKQEEYYALQAVFAGVQRGDRPYDAEPQVHARRQILLRQQRGLETGTYAPGASPFDEAVRAEVAGWEQSLTQRAANWSVLDPVDLKSAGGATLSKQPDLSVVSGGALPDVDTYVITAPTTLSGITAVRLELLADEHFPQNGPGRRINGNLHLNEFHVSAAPASDPGAAEPMEIAAARADFNQDGWTVAMAVDHDPKTAWGIYPAVGQPHAAVFEFKKPISIQGSMLLTFVLEQTHGAGHLIGRMRLSATTASPPPPAEPDTLPAAILSIHFKPSPERTEAERVALASYYLKRRVAEQLKALPPPQLVYAVAGDSSLPGTLHPAKAPRPIYVLKRGDVTHPGELVSPGALSCVSGLDSHFSLPDAMDEPARRAALAKWLSDPKNCLTWRSIVNRVWHYHFGRGIVSTPNDFGDMGDAPTHPELLDWLAAWLMEQGGSLKQLHRLIVTSTTYRQSSANNPHYALIDADNRYLWRMNRTRLDAECVRDSILAMTGLLNPAMGGAAAKQFKPIVGTLTPDYAAFDVDDPASRRASVYREVVRTAPDPFMDALDCPDASQFAPVRNVSVTALQALAMWNDRFVVRYSEHFAERVAAGGRDVPGQIESAFRLCVGRAPTKQESSDLSNYAGKYGMANLCRVLLNSNEFLFVD